MNTLTIIGLTILMAVVNYFLMRELHKYEKMTLGVLLMSCIPFWNAILAVSLAVGLVVYKNKGNSFMNKILGGEGERYK